MPTTAAGHMFLHLPKTGGTTVKRALRAAFGGACVRRGGGHDPARWHVRPGGPVPCGTIRDPWSWYVSAIGHELNTGGDANHRRINSYGATLADKIEGMAYPREGRVPLEGDGVLLGIGSPRDLLASGVSVYRYLLATLYGLPVGPRTPEGASRGVRALVDTARIPEGVSRLTGAPSEAIERVGRANSARERGCGRWRAPKRPYTDILADLVAYADAPVLDLMGYDGPRDLGRLAAPAASAVVRIDPAA